MRRWRAQRGQGASRCMVCSLGKLKHGVDARGRWRWRVLSQISRMSGARSGELGRGPRLHHEIELAEVEGLARSVAALDHALAKTAPQELERAVVAVRIVT